MCEVKCFEGIGNRLRTQRHQRTALDRLAPGPLAEVHRPCTCTAADMLGRSESDPSATIFGLCRKGYLALVGSIVPLGSTTVSTLYGGSRCPALKPLSGPS
jgi:hypothetical protein